MSVIGDLRALEQKPVKVKTVGELIDLLSTLPRETGACEFDELEVRVESANGQTWLYFREVDE
jgi:hypothetical protein